MDYKKEINKIIEEFGDNCSPSFYIKQGMKLTNTEVIKDYKNTMEHLSYKLMENNTVSPYIDRKLEELEKLS